MNLQTLPSPREHHFYVAIAKFLFHHPEHGIVSVRDPIKIKDAERYGLSPLILYGLTVAGLPIRWMTLPRSLNLGHYGRFFWKRGITPRACVAAPTSFGSTATSRRPALD